MLALAKIAVHDGFLSGWFCPSDLVRKYLRVPGPAACGLWRLWMKLWGTLGVSAHKEEQDNQQLPTVAS